MIVVKLYLRRRALMFGLKGIHLKHHKGTASMPPVTIDTPSKVTIPMSMHIGAPAKPVVKVGDTVCVGQLIGEAGAGLCSPVYASISGKVKKLEETLTVSGAKVTAVVIESDGEMKASDDVRPPVIENREDFLAAVKASGIVGLGGAGFPTYVKLGADASKIDTVVVNGAECEPYITSDTRTMLDDSAAVAYGLSLVMKYLEVSRAVIGIEKNKPECIAEMKRAVSNMSGVEIMSLPSVYPQGGEKVLVYNTVGRVIKEGQLPLDAGVIVINCTTLAAIANYVRTGMPLVSKCVTVDGSAVSKPANVMVPIGTSISDVFEFCGGFKRKPKKILMGGPMMGIAVWDISSPILKQTNAILAFDEKDAFGGKETACIKCGKCSAACPFGLSPEAIAGAYKTGDCETLDKLKVNVCMECGCCSYVCPAKKNIVQTNRLAKAKLREYNAAKQGGGK